MCNEKAISTKKCPKCGSQMEFVDYYGYTCTGCSNCDFNGNN